MTRQCGDCQLCCKLLPVADGGTVNGVPLPGSLHKAAGVRCPHQRTGKGCGVYHTQRMPYSCRMWNCRWLVNDDTADLPRPDRCHYVIDIMPDIVRMVNNATGKAQDVEVIQVWIDPAYPKVRHDAALLRYIDRQRKCALMRLNERDSWFIMPPSVSGDVWRERLGHSTDQFPTSVEKLAAKLGYQVALGEPDPVTGMIPAVYLTPEGKEIPLAIQERDNLK
jgi:hypothetical protein